MSKTTSTDIKYYKLCVMRMSCGLILLLILGGLGVIACENSDTVSFDENYHITWGSDHVLASNQGSQIQLSMDRSTGLFFILFLSPISNNLFHHLV